MSESNESTVQGKSQCWFCSRERADDGAAFVINFSGKRTDDWRSVSVPRCATCKKVHCRRTSALKVAFFAPVGVLLSALGLWMIHLGMPVSHSYQYIFWGVMLFSTLAFLVAIIDYVRQSSLPVSFRNKCFDYPPCKELLEQGYREVVGGGEPEVEPHRAATATGFEIMHMAMHRGIEATKEAVEQGLDVNSVASGFTPLHAVALDHLIEDAAEIAAYLIDQGAELDAVAPNGCTPLGLAARPDKAGVFRCLLNAGANIDAGRPNCTPLLSAITHKATESAILLLERGADVSPPEGTPPLMAAVSVDDTAEKLLLAILARGPNIDQQVSLFHGGTALHTAAARGNAKAVELLLRHGADATITNSADMTAADLAIAAGHDQIAESIRAAEGLTEVTVRGAKGPVSVRETAILPPGRTRCPTCSHVFDADENAIAPPETGGPKDDDEVNAEIFKDMIRDAFGSGGQKMQHLICPKCGERWEQNVND